MSGVLVVGRERRENKNKEIEMMVVGHLCKLRKLSIHHVPRIKFQFEFELFISKAYY